MAFFVDRSVFLLLLSTKTPDLVDRTCFLMPVSIKTAFFVDRSVFKEMMDFGFGTSVASINQQAYEGAEADDAEGADFLEMEGNEGDDADCKAFPVYEVFWGGNA